MKAEKLTLHELISLKKQHADRLANQSSAAGESELLDEIASMIPRPKGKTLKVILKALANKGINIKGTSFDAIIVPDGIDVDFSNVESLQASIGELIFVEIKTTKKESVKDDFSGYFFALSEGEIAASEALEERYQVILYNYVQKKYLKTTVADILSRSKSRTWQLSLQL